LQRLVNVPKIGEGDFKKKKGAIRREVRTPPDGFTWEEKPKKRGGFE